MNTITRFPHCDPRILHAPGACRYCDRHQEWQDLRKTWGIAFTNEKPSNDRSVPCPANVARGDAVNYWRGNIARPARTVKVTCYVNGHLTIAHREETVTVLELFKSLPRPMNLNTDAYEIRNYTGKLIPETTVIGDIFTREMDPQSNILYFNLPAGIGG